MRIRLHCTLGELLGRTHFGAATYRFSALPLALAVFDCSICLCHNFVEVFNFDFVSIDVPRLHQGSQVVVFSLFDNSSRSITFQMLRTRCPMSSTAVLAHIGLMQSTCYFHVSENHPLLTQRCAVSTIGMDITSSNTCLMVTILT